MLLRVSRGSLRVAGAVACACLLPLVAGTASLAKAGTRAQATHRMQQVRTYNTPGTLPLRTALLDPFTFTGADQATAFEMARSAGASYIRLVVPWSAIAPITRPDGFAPADPASSAYTWDWLDGSVSAIEANGMTPILDITAAPSWALARQGSHGRAGAPSATALGDFAKAVALRYDGFNGEPPVHVFQVWNEPNLSMDLSPVKAASVYRGMVNAFATAVHGVDPANLVVAGGLDPFGNKASDFVTQAPLAFMRSFLCISKGAHPHATCSTKVDFDVWAHHPYTFDGPFGHAGRPDDVSLGDLPKMRSLLRTATRLHRIASPVPPQFWVTEFGWDTNPPRKHAAPLSLEARWTSEALYQMWHSGVSLATWFLLQDQPSPSRYQSGLFFHSTVLKSARAKPMRAAFRFPFVAYLGTGTVRIWGRDATSDKRLLTIQRRHGIHGGWRVIARIHANSNGIFVATLRLKAVATDWLTASATGSGNSPAFSLTVPKKQRFGPWGN